MNTSEEDLIPLTVYIVCLCEIIEHKTMLVIHLYISTFLNNFKLPSLGKKIEVFQYTIIQ